MFNKKIIVFLALVLIISAFTVGCEEIEEAVEEIETSVTEEYEYYYAPQIITLEEFNLLQTGMTYNQVVNIIGGEGTLFAEYDSGFGKCKTYTWEGLNLGSSASLSFTNGYLETKMQFGLE